MAISDKLNYLIETKSQLKDMINYGLPTENQITNETTFRNYVKGIFEAFIESLRDSTTLYTNLPKISGNGTQITLNDTANAPMRITLKASELEQQTTTGKNLLPVTNQDFTINNVRFQAIDGKIKISGTANANVTGFIMKENNYFPITLPAGTYYLSRNLTDTSVGLIKGNNDTVVATLSSSSSYKYTSFTLTETTLLYLFFYIANGTQKNETFEIMVSTTNSEWERYTYGASPNPSYPQDIHTISGNNSVVVNGKNLIGLGTSLNGYVDASTMKMQTVSTSIGYYFKTSQLPNTLTISDTGGNRMSVCYFNDIPANNVVAKSRSASNDNPRTIAVDKTYTYIHIQFSYREENVTNIQLESGSTATTYEPYVSQTAPINLDTIEYCKIGNYEDEFILTSGKNLFDKDGNKTTGKIYDSSGNQTASSADDFCLNDYINVLPNTQYTISGSTYLRVCEYKNDKTFIIRSVTSGNDSSATFTTTSNTYYVRISALISKINNIQLEKGTSASSYEPYGTNQWYLKKNIGKVVLDGSENFTSAGTSGTDYRYNKTLSNLNIPNATTNNGLCISNYFQNVTIDTSKKWGAFYINGNWLVFYDKNQEMTDATTFNMWLSNNNTTIYYVLATPTYTQITGTLETQLNNIHEKLLSYKGTTNISQVNNDLPFVLGISAIQDLE